MESEEYRSTAQVNSGVAVYIMEDCTEYCLCMYLALTRFLFVSSDTLSFFFYGSFTVVDVVDKLKRVTVARDFHTLRLYFF